MPGLFNFQPSASGTLVSIRPLLDSDQEALWKVCSDPLVWEQLPRCERYKKEVFDPFFEESISLKTAVAIIDNQSEQIIGSSRYARLDLVKSEVEIGWTFLSRQYWGKGHNADSKQLMLKNAFSFVESVFLVAAATNYRSRSAIEKLGAKEEQQLNWPPNTKVQDLSVLYRIYKKDWFSKSQASN